MSDFNIMVPFTFILARVATYGTLIIIFVKSNGGSVIMLENPHQRKIELMHDGQNRLSHVSYYAPFKAIIPNADMV
ncbi:MAG: hypothetical protein EOO18_10430 [Chryseobacterium sp.]|nr:MAG: hypothetical protein EOO18_10430 [Chryseobacterium sp.]